MIKLLLVGKMVGVGSIAGRAISLSLTRNSGLRQKQALASHLECLGVSSLSRLVIEKEKAAVLHFVVVRSLN